MEIRLIDTPEEMLAVLALQSMVWPGNDVEVVPKELMLAAVHSGGMLLGAYEDDQLLGAAFSFLGLAGNPKDRYIKHCSHFAAVHPDYRDKGIGFALKRAQWQLVRAQGIDLITWTYDPLQSRNANFNIAKLGAVCNTYHREYYGEMLDGLNRGIPSDRFQVDWWVNTTRVERRLSKHTRPNLDLAHYFGAGVSIINPTSLVENSLPQPHPAPLDVASFAERPALLLLEIPADIMAIKAQAPQLAVDWRLHTRALFENLFSQGYLVTDFVYLSGTAPRSFYVLSHGEATLRRF